MAGKRRGILPAKGFPLVEPCGIITRKERIVLARIRA